MRVWGNDSYIEYALGSCSFFIQHFSIGSICNRIQPRQFTTSLLLLSTKMAFCHVRGSTFDLITGKLTTTATTKIVDSKSLQHFFLQAERKWTNGGCLFFVRVWRIEECICVSYNLRVGSSSIIRIPYRVVYVCLYVR